MPTEKAAAPAPAAPAPLDYSAIAAELPTDAPTTEEAPVTEKPVEKPVEAKPEGEEKPKGEEKPAEKGEGDPFKRGFEQLVKQQKELREAREASKHGFELAEVVSPAQAAALKTALAKGDKLGVMNALGISYTDIASAMVGASKGEAPKPPAEKPQEEQKPVAVLPPEVQEVVAAYKQMQAQQQKQTIDTAIKDVITKNATKLKHVAGLEAVDEVSAVLEEMYRRAGGLPSNDPVENIRIAAEEAESRLARQAARWSKVLTPATDSATIPSGKAPVTPVSPAQSSGGKTLTNKLGAPAPSTTPSDNLDDLFRDIAKSLP